MPLLTASTVPPPIPTVVAATAPVTTTIAAPKAVLVQTTPVVSRTIAPHHLLQMTATPMVNATVGNGIHKVGSTLTIGALPRVPVAPISFPAQVSCFVTPTNSVSVAFFFHCSHHIGNVSCQSQRRS